MEFSVQGRTQIYKHLTSMQGAAAISAHIPSLIKPVKTERDPNSNRPYLLTILEYLYICSHDIALHLGPQMRNPLGNYKHFIIMKPCSWPPQNVSLLLTFPLVWYIDLSLPKFLNQLWLLIFSFHPWVRVLQALEEYTDFTYSRN